eukprot:COSAG01_NODE_4713_length_4797_cov_84.010856_1_plen_203_part_00
MCNAYWTSARRAANKEANMQYLGCLDEGQPLKIKPETLITFLTYVAVNLERLGAKLSVRNVNMHNVCVAAFKRLAATTGGFMRLDVYDGLIEKGHEVKRLPVCEPPGPEIVPLHRNGVVECDISLRLATQRREKSPTSYGLAVLSFRRFSADLTIVALAVSTKSLNSCACAALSGSPIRASTKSAGLISERATFGSRDPGCC